MDVVENHINIKLLNALQECFDCVSSSNEKKDLSSQQTSNFAEAIFNAVGEKSIFTTPLTMMWKLTSKCNLRCKHCFFHGKENFLNSENDLSKQEILDFAKFCVEELNIISVMISGGEPFASDAIFDLLEYLTENNIYTIIQTNGTLINSNTINKLKQIIKPQLTKFEISLEGVCPETNDYIRGQGAFEKTLYAIRELVKMDFAICLNTTLTTANINEVSYICDFCKENGIKELNIGKFEDISEETHYLAPKLEDCFIAIAEVIRNAKKNGIIFNPIFLSFPDILKFPEGRAIVDKRLKEYTESNGRPKCICCSCHKHDRFLILSDGNITFCPSLDKTEYCIGNIKENHFEDIWNNRFNYPIFQDRKSETFACGKCKYLVFCQAGCFARAYNKFGTINAPDSNCNYYKELDFTGEEKC